MVSKELRWEGGNGERRTGRRGRGEVCMDYAPVVCKDGSSQSKR